MQPYVNPYLFQQTPYQMYQPQMQTYQPQTPTLNGKLIDNIESINANDVPMQGISVFPKNDLSEVYIKSWNANGTIQTIRFAPVKAETPTETTVNVPVGETEIMKRLSDIENKIDKIVMPVKARKANDES